MVDQLASDRGAAETRDNLLAAAVQVFAEQGYQQARVRDIAARAGANPAAINYHFGGKRGLYRRVLERLAQQTIGRHPLPERSTTMAPEAALRAAIAALLRRFLADDPNAALPQLMLRELAAPTEALPLVIRSMIEPQYRQLGRLVADVIPAADAACLQRCVFSIVSQCVFYRFARPLVSTLAPDFYADDPVPALSAHIAAFSLAGLQHFDPSGAAA